MGTATHVVGRSAKSTTSFVSSKGPPGAAHLASGWLVFAFGACFPVLGWFVILPYVTLSGLGSVVVGAFPARASATPVKDIEYPEK